MYVMNIIQSLSNKHKFSQSCDYKIIGNTNSALSNGNTSYPSPYGSYYKSNKTQILILASELTNAGITPNTIISRIGVFVSNTNNVGVMNSTYIKIKETTLNSLTTNYVTDMYTMFNKQTYYPKDGLNVHNTFGYLWQGNNLVVEFGHSNLSISYTYNASVIYTQTSFNSVINSHNDNIDQEFTTGGNVSTNRPNVIIHTGGTLPPKPVISLKASNKLTYTNENINLIPFDVISGSIVNYLLIGMLPAGVTFNATNGSISGRSYATVTSTFSIVGISNTVQSDPVTFTLTFTETFPIIYIGNINSASSNTNTGYPAPYGNYYFGSKHQILVLASELLANGGVSGKSINTIGFDVSNTNNSPALQNFKIKVGHVTNNSITSTTFVNTLTTVVNSTTYTPNSGLNVHTLNNTFVWNGTDNLLVEIVFNNASWVINASHKNTNTNFNSCLYYIADSLTVESQVTGSTITTTRPNIFFKFNP